MKKFLTILSVVALAIAAVSCEKGGKAPKTYPVKVQLTLFGSPFAEEGIPVSLSSGSASYSVETDAEGIVSFDVPVGIYTATTSFKKDDEDENIKRVYNGSVSITVTDQGAEMPKTISVDDPEIDPEDDGDISKPIPLPLEASQTSNLIIKELYNGGCWNERENKQYITDKYIIIYNNSAKEMDASKMCIAMAQISNTVGNAANDYNAGDGNQSYFAEGWTPASYAVWWFQEGTSVKIAPYSQIVVSICGAVDHSVTIPNSVDLSGADYVMYDKEAGFNAAAWYPAPSSTIPSSHYMKTSVFGMGTSWAIPMQNAAPFIFEPKSKIQDFVLDEGNFVNKASNKSGNFCKIPTDWVLDAVDIWKDDNNTTSFHRFSPAINTGHVVFAVNKNGSTIYRNVDKEATEAIEGNASKLVYNYAGAFSEEDTDPSGIDAEASIANGAKIVYMDTNNSANDFHVRKVASIK